MTQKRKAALLARSLICFIFICLTTIKTGSLLGQQDDQVFALVERYITVSDWRERIPLVYQQDRVHPLMEDYYSKDPWRKLDFKLNMEGSLKWEGNSVQIQTIVNGQKFIVYVRKQNGDIKIDWEATTGYNPLSVASFKARLINKPMTFRVVLELSDYYNGVFRDAKETHFSFHMRTFDGTSIGTGYIPRSSKPSLMLFAALEDGLSHRAVIEFQRVPDDVVSDLYLITNVVGIDTWYIASKADIVELQQEREAEMREKAKVLAERAKMLQAEKREKSFRIWNSTDNKFSVEARFLNSVSGKVKLEKRSGEEITVPIEKLSDVDQTYIKSGSWR